MPHAAVAACGEIAGDTDVRSGVKEIDSAVDGIKEAKGSQFARLILDIVGDGFKVAAGFASVVKTARGHP